MESSAHIGKIVLTGARSPDYGSRAELTGGSGFAFKSRVFRPISAGHSKIACRAGAFVTRVPFFYFNIGSLAATTRQNAERTDAKLVVGNWKMHGRLTENAADAGSRRRRGDVADDVRVGVCVPSPYLAQAQALLGGSVVAWGAQDVSAHTQGAYTGEVAARMVADFDATFAIVGHSERRAYHGEASELVAVKAQRALEAGFDAYRVCRRNAGAA